MLIGSPVCTAFSVWQTLNRFRHADSEEKRLKRIEAELHMRFVISLYHEQSDGGRYFLHEHPWAASSSALRHMQDLMAVPGVQKVTGDQCQFGAEIQRGPQRGAPVMKPTGFLTNA